MENDTGSKKLIKIVFKILYQIIIIMCVLLTLIIVFQKFTDSNRTIGGYRIFRVITGSMLPEYEIGEVVICKEIDPEKIQIGDDIVYKGTYGEYNGKIIMHEVTGIDKDIRGNLTFHAKGLHISSVEDPEIKESQIYGVVKLKSKILTLLYKLATSIYSAFIIITILVFNVFMAFRFPGGKITRVEQLQEHTEDLETENLDDENEPEEQDDVEVEENDIQEDSKEEEESEE